MIYNYKEGYELLYSILITFGEKLQKKHGEWRKLNVWGDIYLILDTWNCSISYYKGAQDTGTDNMYRVIYTFKGFLGNLNCTRDFVFWTGHLGKYIMQLK